MKKVEPRHNHDCAASSLAAILELPIEQMPDFWTADSATKFHARIASWLRKQGFHWYYSDIEPRSMSSFREEKTEDGNTWPPRGYWLARISRVEWLRDCGPAHIVVMRDHRCVFNPGGTTSDVLDPDVWLLGYFLLVPLDPARKE